MLSSYAIHTASPSVIIMMAGCALVLGLVLQMVNGAAANARRTAAGTGLATVAAVWLLLMFADDFFPGRILSGDRGLDLASVSCVALMACMGALDRSRTIGMVMFALGITAAINFYAYPLIRGVLVPLSPVFLLYALFIMAGCAHLVLVSMMKPASRRFTVHGQRRSAYQGSPSAIEGWASGLTATAILALSWALKQYGEADIAAHIYTGMTASVIAASVAMLVALKRRSASPMGMAVLALPAGVLSSALLEAPGPIEISLLAALAGAAVTLTRDALISLRIDEPTGSTAAFFVPSMIGALAPGIVDLGQLATQVEWLGALIASGLSIGIIWRIACRLTLGLSLSRRAAEEGLDMVYTVVSARR